MTAPILLSTVGSLGDLFPLIALSRAIEAEGQTVRLVVGPDDAEVAEEHGVEAITIGPSERELSARLGMSRDEIAASVFRDPSPLLARATYPMLADLTREMLTHAEGARAIGGTALALAAPLAAEMAGKPYIRILLQPTMRLSALDPPRVKGFVPPMRAKPSGAIGRGWNRAWIKVVETEMRRRHGRDQARVRRDLGLPANRHLPFFGDAVPPALRLGLWDPLLSDTPDDVPDLSVTGFCALDQGRDLPGDLARFLDAGPPPMVVTLGSVAHKLLGEAFWRDTVDLARSRGLRVVLLSGSVQMRAEDDVLSLPYAAHAPLFARARVILHHGGMGTLGTCLAAGVPQLIRPIGADQPDNASRCAELGVARRIERPDSSEAREALDDMLTDESARRARDVAARLIPDGARRAARVILDSVAI